MKNKKKVTKSQRNKNVKTKKAVKMGNTAKKSYRDNVQSMN